MQKGWFNSNTIYNALCSGVERASKRFKDFNVILYICNCKMQCATNTMVHEMCDSNSKKGVNTLVLYCDHAGQFVPWKPSPHVLVVNIPFQFNIVHVTEVKRIVLAYDYLTSLGYAVNDMFDEVAYQHPSRAERRLVLPKKKSNEHMEETKMLCGIFLPILESGNSIMVLNENTEPRGVIQMKFDDGYIDYVKGYDRNYLLECTPDVMYACSLLGTWHNDCFTVVSKGENVTNKIIGIAKHLYVY